jgi:glycosyltransferase involved in cell wall biosynthesis
MSAVRVVLCMIVRNEASVIERCLDSALPYADGYVISDTGSSDATVRLIEQAAARHGVPGAIRRHEWQHFGHNRSLSAEEARAWVAAQGWPPESTYLLFLDADMLLRVEAGFDKQALAATSYMLVQDDGTLRYWNIRLACLSHGWEAVGVTHEYWQPLGAGVTSDRLDTLWIEDRGDGGNKGDKFQRDIRLLTRALEVEPNNPRYVLYLAQSYFDSGRWADAVRTYERRWQLGGWDEERWYARFRQGWSLLRLGDGIRAAGVLLDAFDARPSRAEPLWLLARYYRDHNQNHAALMLALRGVEIPYPEGDLLFVDTQVYDWLLWEEVMISAFYAGARYHDVGFSACERLLARRGHEPWFYAYVTRNQKFYLRAARSERGGALTVAGAASEVVVPRAATPAAMSTGAQVYLTLRLPADHVADTRYPTFEADGAFRPYYLTATWDPVSAGAAAAGSFGLPADLPADTSGRAFDDIRWTPHGGRVWFTAVYYAGDAGGGRVALGRMTERLDAVDHAVAVSSERIPPVDACCVPWSRSDGLWIVAAYDPFVALSVDPVSGQVASEHTSTPPFRASAFRGCAAPVPIPDSPGEYLGLVHELSRSDSGDLQTHRWIRLREDDGLVACSRPFFFERIGLERAAGLCATGSGVLVVYETPDREARWAEFSWPAVLSSLRTAEASPV